MVSDNGRCVSTTQGVGIAGLLRDQVVNFDLADDLESSNDDLNSGNTIYQIRDIQGLSQSTDLVALRTVEDLDRNQRLRI